MSVSMTGVLVALNLVLLFLIMAAPLGVRRFTLVRRIPAPAETVWQALWPLGRDAGWSGEILKARQTGNDPLEAELVYSWPGRDGNPIRRVVRLEGVRDHAAYSLRVTDDSSLASSFWADYREDVEISAGEGFCDVRLTRQDRYRGLAFLVFRYFAARRSLDKLKRWAETGEFVPGGIFERPATQVAMAVLSAFVLWPFFGLSAAGLAMAVTLTFVIAAHELGHMVAFRIMGHKSTRMIFIPILGGIAIGGRPYDSRYEIAFVALMGSGLSALALPPLVALHGYAGAGNYSLVALIAGGVAACTAFFNLANLAPVWKFDGGQILRQLVPATGPRAAASFLLMAFVMDVGLASGFPTEIVLVAGAIFAILGVMTADSGVQPKAEMSEMTGRQRAILSAGLAATVYIHGAGVVWAMTVYF